MPELEKPERAACEHLDEGCSIHADRPASCRRFTCGWLAGRFGLQDRPDRSGVMIVDAAAMFGGTPELWEVWAGASSTGPGASILATLRTAGYAVTLVTADERRSVMPTPLTVSARRAG